MYFRKSNQLALNLHPSHSRSRHCWNSTLLIAFVVVCVCSGRHSAAQQVNHQLGFLCDNNFLLLNGDDGYYTSGLFLGYHRQRVGAEGNRRPVFSFEVGQMIYNAHSRKILPASYGASFPSGIGEIDRPIAGYLFAKASRTSFINRSTILRVGASVGVVGESSGGRLVQQTWHRWIGVKEHWNWVWDYQVKNELGANLHGMIATTIIKSNPKHFQVTTVTQATIGSQLTNLAQGVLIQVGKLRALQSASYWNAGIGSWKSDNFERELYFFYHPQMMYQVYNATIQGGMFRQGKGPIVTSVWPWVLMHTTGFRFSFRRFDVGYHVTFQNKEAKTQRNRQSYASLITSFRF